MTAGSADKPSIHLNGGAEALADVSIRERWTRTWNDGIRGTGSHRNSLPASTAIINQHWNIPVTHGGHIFCN